MPLPPAPGEAPRHTPTQPRQQQHPQQQDQEEEEAEEQEVKKGGRSPLPFTSTVTRSGSGRATRGLFGSSASGDLMAASRKALAKEVREEGKEREGGEEREEAREGKEVRKERFVRENRIHALEGGRCEHARPGMLCRAAICDLSLVRLVMCLTVLIPLSCIVGCGC